MPQYEYACAAGHVTVELRRIANRAQPGPTCAEPVKLVAPEGEQGTCPDGPCGLPTTYVEIASEQGRPHEGYVFKWLVNGVPTEAQSNVKRRGHKPGWERG